MPFSGTPGQAGSLPFNVLAPPGAASAVPAGVTFTALFTRGASVVAVPVSVADIGALASGIGRSYVATWVWPVQSGLYRLLIENNYDSGVVDADFEVGVGGGDVTQGDIDAIPAAVASLDITAYVAAGSIASHLKASSQLASAQYTEVVTVRARRVSNAAIPHVHFRVGAAGGARLHEGFVDSLGNATILLPVGSGYTLTAHRADMTFDQVSFSVAVGGTTVTAVGKTPGVVVTGS